MRQNLKIKWPWNINLWTDNKSTVAINPFIINIECSQQQQPKTAIQFTKLHLLLFTIKMKKVHLITCTSSRVQNKTNPMCLIFSICCVSVRTTVLPTQWEFEKSDGWKWQCLPLTWINKHSCTSRFMYISRLQCTTCILFLMYDIPSFKKALQTHL